MLDFTQATDQLRPQGREAGALFRGPRARRSNQPGPCHRQRRPAVVQDMIHRQLLGCCVRLPAFRAYAVEYRRKRPAVDCSSSQSPSSCAVIKAVFMAELREESGERCCTLMAEHLIGRGPQCALRLDPKYVSTQHAVIRWSGNGWELIDRASR